MCFDWWRELPEQVEVWGVQPPGREERADEPPYRRLDLLVETAARELDPAFGGRFAFFGHSLGALVAFELVRHLRRAGGPQPLALFASGRWAPQLPAPTPPIHSLPEDELWEGVRAYGGVPPALSQEPELRAVLTPLLRADFAVSETYDFREELPLEQPLIALGGERDPQVKAGDLLAWREHTTGRFRLHVFPGDHFFIHTDRLLVLRELSEELRNLPAGLPGRAGACIDSPGGLS